MQAISDFFDRMFDFEKERKGKERTQNVKLLVVDVVFEALNVVQFTFVFVALRLF